LRDVTLNERLKYIKQGGFEKCISLEVINIPSTLTGIGSMIFQGCSKLKKALLENVQLIQPHFKIVHLWYPSSCPQTVWAIHKGAFSCCIKLEEILLHEGLKKIDDRAFSSYLSLKRITLPSTIRELGKRVFYNCINLNEVY
jgi:hypothetical protein